MDDRTKRSFYAAALAGLFLFGWAAATAATKPDAVFRGTAYSYGRVYDAKVQTDGKRILAGSFIETNGSDGNTNIVRLNADNSLDTSFVCRTDKQIRKVQIRADGKIYIAGFFSTVNGTTRINLTRLNADGSLDASFNAPANIGSGINDGGEILVQPDGKLLVVGTFFPGIVRLNFDGSRDTSFNVGAGPRFQGSLGEVKTLALQTDGKVLVTGTFDTFNTTARQNIVRLNTDGSVDTDFDPGAGASAPGTALLSLADGSTLWAASGLVRKFGRNGTLDATFSTTVAPLLRTNLVQQPDGKILISYYSLTGDEQDGDFTGFIRRINLNGANDTDFNGLTANDTIIFSVALQTDGRILVNGSFYKISNQPRIGVFLLETNGNLNAAFNPVLKDRGTIADLDVQPDGGVIVGGSFFEINGIERGNIARLLPGGAVDPSFNANFESLVDSPPYFTAVRKIARLANGKIIVGGRFNRVNGAARYQIVRLNAGGATDTGFNLPRNTVISAFQYFAMEVQPDGKILTNGGTLSGGSETWRIIRLNANGTPDTGFADGAQGLASDIKLDSTGAAFASGFFFNASSDVVKIKTSGTLDTGFNAPPSSDGLNSTALGIQPDGKILVARFTGGGLIRLNANGSVDTAFAPNIVSLSSPRIWKILTQSDGKIILGGSFVQINSVNRDGLARLNADGTLDGSFNANGLITNGLTLALALQSNGNLVFGGKFSRPNGGRQDVGRILNSSAPADVDGDGRTDFAVFRPSNGTWFSLLASDRNFPATPFGIASDKLVPGDYDGDGRTDIAVFRSGFWYRINSATNQFSAVQFGQTGDVPAAADFDADGKADIAVFRSGFWYVSRSSDGGLNTFQFGQNGDVPAAGDFDGDGRADYAVFRSGTWFVAQSSAGFRAVQFGQANDVPLNGDFDGDGKKDFAVFRGGEWYVLNSRDASFRAERFGLAADVPTVGDYDGDNKSDVAVWRPADGTFYVLQSSDRSFRAAQFGQNGDVPIAAP